VDILIYCQLVLWTAVRHSASVAQAVLFLIFVAIGAAILVLPNFGMTINPSSLTILADPKFYAVLFGSIVIVRLVCAPFWVWKAERKARLAAEERANDTQRRLDEKRCRLLVKSIKCVPAFGDKQYIKEIKNDGPVVAIGVQMSLTRIYPAPRGAPHLETDCPHKVFHSHRTFDHETIGNISVGQSEVFEPINISSNGVGPIAIGNIDTKRNRQITIEIGEEWNLQYQVFAENADSIDFTLVIRRKDDGSVVVDEYH
jgi:hypothetical protein